MNSIYLRTSAYAVLAIGLIKGVYQSSEPGVISKVAPIVTLGLLASIIFALKSFEKFTRNRTVGYLWLMIALLLVIYSFLN